MRYLKPTDAWQAHAMCAKLAETHVPTYLSPDVAVDQWSGGVQLVD